ncbi:MAG: LamB/YcsF family protein [Saprospiraceae bacterium]|nr:LamB/YcsF family protein [Saprospiraceae bacterium]
MASLCIKEEIPFWWEAFGDRRYLPDGQLAPREMQDALIEDPQLALEQVLLLAQTAPVSAIDGSSIQVPCDTICFHTDAPASFELLKYVINGMKEIAVK